MFLEKRLLHHQDLQFNLIIQEQDGSPYVEGVNNLVFPNTSVTDNGDGSVTLNLVSTSSLTFTQGSIPFAGATGTLTQDNASLFFDDVNNRLGIGIITPRRKLDILDATNPQLRLTHTDNSVYTDLQTNSSGYLSITPSGGRVGINTATPLETMQIGDGTTATDQFLAFQTNNDKNVGIRYYLTDGTTIRGYVYWEKEENLKIKGDGIFFDSLNRNNSLVIRESGLIGINTINPRVNLDVLNNTNPQQRWTHTDNSIYTEGQTTSNGYFELNATGNRILLGKDDSDKTYFGAGYDFSIYYDGTNAVINPKEVGSGILDILGTLQTDGYNSADGTAGATEDVATLAPDGTTTRTLHFKNGLYTGKTDS